MKKLRILYNFFKPLFKKYKYLFFAWTSLFFVGNTLTNVFVPRYYKKNIDLATEQFSSGVFSFAVLKTVLISLFFILLLAMIGRRAGSYLLSVFSSKMRPAIHNYAFEKVLEKNYSFFADTASGAIVGKTNRLNQGFMSVLQTLFFGFFLLYADIILSSIVLFRESKTLGLVMISFFILFTIFSIFASKKKLVLEERRAKLGTKRFGVLSDAITNIQNILYFAGHEGEKESYSEKVDQVKRAQLDVWFYSDHIRLVKNILFIFFEVGILYISLSLFTKGEITLGTLVLAQTYTSMFIIFSWNLSKSINSYVETLSDMKDAIEVIDADELEYSGNISLNKNESANISFKNISFKYPKGEAVFNNFSLDIPQGQSVGLVGVSGSGKTTITKLLLSLFNVDSGKVLLAGKDISEIDKKDLRNYISYVPQESILFHRSIMENIRYAKPEASDREIFEIAKSAHVNEFVESFEEKYNTKVGERGIKLSGGQRQRIGIARAMLKSDSPLLIMDEATSALDSQSEEYIQKSFAELSKNRTTIVVAHRLSTIQNLDRIIVLDKGKIIEDGSHNELLKKGAAYAKLWNSQSGGFLQD